MGLGENFRPKLPSRNWTIFLTITGSFAAAVIYDKREKKRVQRKWCRLVEHVGKEPLDSRAMPRKLTVFLEAPPSDGLRSAQDHFKEYVKPVLVASGLDWEFIQGRKEGDIRADLATKIRNSRLPPEQRTEDDPALDTRRKNGINDFEGPCGDIVIGRHTWKEYVRGLHEGWLGPPVEPTKPEDIKTPDEPTPTENPIDTLPGSSDTSPGEIEKPSAEPEPTPEPEKAPEKPKKPAAFISTADYKNASTPQLPDEFDPSTPISFPHILGFLNTPKRIYRFLNRRALADSIGRDTAAIILSTYRPYHTTTESASSSGFTPDAVTDSPQVDGGNTAQATEQQTALIEEEKEWHKSVRERKEDEPERTWLEPIVLDPRISSRMRKSELTAEEEERAKTFIIPEEEIEGWIKGGLRSLGRSGWKYLTEKKKRPVAEGLVEDED